MILLRDLFEELLFKDKTFTIHHQNVQSMAIEMYKAVNNLPRVNISEFFVRNIHNYNHRRTSWGQSPSQHQRRPPPPSKKIFLK